MNIIKKIKKYKQKSENVQLFDTFVCEDIIIFVRINFRPHNLWLLMNKSILGVDLPNPTFKN